jgi:hypothetical protein
MREWTTCGVCAKHQEDGWCQHRVNVTEEMRAGIPGITEFSELVCTRKIGHRGPHVACAPKSDEKRHMIYAWEKE